MLSVLTPSFQYGRFLGDALASVLEQNGLEVEHIVQDGGSTDGTVELLRAAPPGVRWVSEPDGGQSDALNRALARARGEWVAWLNADEFYLPGGLARLLDAAKETGADVVYGDCVFVDEQGRVLRLVPQHRFYRRILEQFGPFIASCATIFRREVLGETPWDPAVERIMDWDLYLRLAAAGARFHWIPYPVGAFRVHGSRITARPAMQFEDSYRRVAARWHLRRSRVSLEVGRILHGLAKLAAGSYARQFRARRLRGRDLRWFRSAEGWRTAVALLREVYRLPPPSRLGESSNAS
jgi:glycosyltransferase involved in cell wall biosynthesis